MPWQGNWSLLFHFSFFDVLGIKYRMDGGTPRSAKGRETLCLYCSTDYEKSQDGEFWLWLKGRVCDMSMQVKLVCMTLKWIKLLVLSRVGEKEEMCYY